ncbi:hypothetical protein [Streptomyces roseochromogenus]|uniref:Uncharacterized protein n=1 Tax=Streptomyces roseochromogenus subsp. oscitans DS 12.976 TaxID=1352936 RepID=V6KA68_STRRC|nr:hypothetical protein [Streptomyces roseochromogenus]EST28301.1 hypothetical protein M878_22815 [Streptomyces roseochromogenus subsp. oscitans DS 12.976]
MRYIAALFIAGLLTAVAAPSASAGEHDNNYVCDTHTISSLCW